MFWPFSYLIFLSEVVSIFVYFHKRFCFGSSFLSILGNCISLRCLYGQFIVFYCWKILFLRNCLYLLL